jgi:hypothetical protein
VSTGLRVAVVLVRKVSSSSLDALPDSLETLPAQATSETKNGNTERTRCDDFMMFFSPAPSDDDLPLEHILSNFWARNHSRTKRLKRPGPGKTRGPLGARSCAGRAVVALAAQPYRFEHQASEPGAAAICRLGAARASARSVTSTRQGGLIVPVSGLTVVQSHPTLGPEDEPLDLDASAMRLWTARRHELSVGLSPSSCFPVTRLLSVMTPSGCSEPALVCAPISASRAWISCRALS